jgi:hypothetical protein
MQTFDDRYWIFLIIPLIIALLSKYRFHIFVWKDSKGYKRTWITNKYAHRKIVEQGRKTPLRKLIIHHKNGNKSDNKKKNLQVMSRSRHSRFHAKRSRKNKKKMGKNKQV